MSTMTDISPELNPELYFLIARFLESGPCKEAADVLKRQLEETRVLPRRTDWEGGEHYRSYENLKSQYHHIAGDHLLQLCQRLGPLLEKEVPSNVKGIHSLLGAGKHSLLRTQKSVEQASPSPSYYDACRHGKPIQPPPQLTRAPSLVRLCSARSNAGCARIDMLGHWRIYSKMSLMTRNLGHLSAVYCVCYDRTGKYIFTGADDHLIKIWSAVSGRLLSTLRGHSAEITDMAINYENTLLAAGSCDKTIRVWELRTTAPVAVLQAHSGMVTSLQFCPFNRGEHRFLMSTGADGCVCYWEWTVSTSVFNPKPVKFVERSRAGAQMLCSSFSPGGVFLATGSSDHVVRVFCFGGSMPEKICELEAHTDRVDSIQYANHCQRFISGSKDGTARIWRYERQEWRAIVLSVSQHLGNAQTPPAIGVDGKPFQYSVTMVSWSQDDTLVVTAVNDHTLKVWCSHTGNLRHVLKGHHDEMFVLEHNPSDARIMLSAGHDGYIILWDIVAGVQITQFFNNIEGQGHGAVFDCKWAPDGLSFVATDSHGYKLVYAFGSNERFKKLPEEMFFHTDYRPLIRDANNYVLDEQTQQPPHLMPPAFLVDIDGNPHPPELQRLVPGREGCQQAQLVPQIGVTPSGDPEVLDDALEEPVPPHAVPGPPPLLNEPPGPHANIDDMIQRLQRERDMQQMPAPAQPPPHAQPAPINREPMSPPHARHPRRSGEMEGVRQAIGNVPVSQRATESDIVAWRHRTIVKELSLVMARSCENRRQYMAEEEIKIFITERKKKPIMSEDSSDSNSYIHTRKKSKKPGRPSKGNEERARNRLQARALYDTDEEELMNSSNTEVEELDEDDKVWSSGTEGDSSDYSDWEEDAGLMMQPPKRTSARKPKKKKWFSSEEEDAEEDDEAYDVKDEEEDEDQDEEKTPKKKSEKSLPKRESRQRRERKQQKALWADQQNIQELPDEYRPPEWLTAALPRKTPYVPQMGDEVVYFRQGHQLYIHAVRRRKIYDVHPNKNHPWHKLPRLRDQEIVKVVGIKYEIRPPRLVCLKLAFIDSETSKLTGGSFTIKYHDMPDVIDFIVLRQAFEIAVSRDWTVGDRFRSMIDDAWWTGSIESEEPMQLEFPDSRFQSLNVRWDNGEREKMSPWDMEPLSERYSSAQSAGSIAVTDGELKALLYHPREGEWPACGRESECERIVHCLEQLMEKSCAEAFLAPVDLSAFPVYAMTIEYPIDLSTIKARLESGWYRRISSVMFDVRHIEINATKFNMPDSFIVKQAKFVCELCLRCIRDSDCHDLSHVYSELAREEEFVILRHSNRGRETADVDVEAGEGTSSGIRMKSKGHKSAPSIHAWKDKCQHLVELLMECEDSEPFREPVNIIDYPDYYELIEHPTDLGDISEKIAAGEFKDPTEFSHEVHTMFHNSRTYNTNKRSKIYAMTLRMSAMFDDHIKDIIGEWKHAVKARKSNKWPAKSSKSSQSSSSKTSPSSSAANSQAKSSTSASTPSNSSSRPSSSKKTPPGKNSKNAGSAHKSSSRSGRPPRLQPHTTRSGRTVKPKCLDSDTEPATDDNSSDSDATDESDTPQTKRSQLTPGRRPAINGHSKKRYTTRNSTGAIRRKKYESEDEEPEPDGRASKRRKINVQTNGSLGHDRSKKRRRYESDDDEPPPPSPVWRNSAKKTRRLTMYDSEDNASVPEEADGSDEETEVEGQGSSSDSSSSNHNNSDSGESSASSTSESEDSDSEVEVRRSSRASTQTSTKATSSAEKQKQRIAASKSPPAKVTGSGGKTSRTSTPPRATGKGKNSVRTRNQGRRTVTYEESDNGECEDVDSDATIEDEITSVSSRGRVRKMTSRARANLFGNS